MHDIIVQLVGFAGLACFLASYQIKSNKGLYFAQSGGNLLFMIQFILLGAISGTYSLLAGFVRNLLMTRYNDWKWVRWKGWVVIFTTIYALIMYRTWQGWTSILPFIGMTSCTIAFWTNNALNIRKANLFAACPAWIIYDIIFHSWAGVANESITILSILVSIWRFGWKNLGDPDSGFSG